MLTCTSLLSQGFSSCWLFFAFADDLRSELNSLNKFAKTKRKTKLEIYGHIHKFFQFHTKVKQLSIKSFSQFDLNINGSNFRLLNDLVDVYKLMFTAEVTYVSVTLSVTLLIFQLEIVA